MGLRLYNTLTRKVEDFKPLEEGRVGIYVCGPTVYGHAHLGHGKSYVSFDVLVRYLRYLGYTVDYVQNITDVGHLTDDADAGEDKIGKQAARERKHPMAIAEYYTRSYFEDMDALNCLRPDISPRATGHIPEQIELVQTLIEKGYAYEVNGSVYFDVSKWPSYGRLSGRNVEDMQAGARVDINEEKRHPADFALWKKAEPGHIMQWNSPWGRGYPGWHLECSAMSMKYLGRTIDIHGGGIENQFPHHECEIAQSEAANGVPFVRTWMHHNMVTVDGQKMGKSLNNFITLKQIFSTHTEHKHERLSRKYDPLAVRQLILQSHYRSPIDFSDAALSAAQSGYDKITNTVKSLRKKIEKIPGKIEETPGSEINEYVKSQLQQNREKFETAMNDDLNTSIALSIIFKIATITNEYINYPGPDKVTKSSLLEIDKFFRNLGGNVLGIIKDEYDQQVESDDIKRYELAIDGIIEWRNEARRNKNFVIADKLRGILGSVGIILEDKPDHTSWRLG
jgi:cysteinyl-tRNA synthetase